MRSERATRFHPFLKLLRFFLVLPIADVTTTSGTEEQHRRNQPCPSGEITHLIMTACKVLHTELEANHKEMFRPVNKSGLTPGITRRPKRFLEFESRRVAGRVHAVVRLPSRRKHSRRSQTVLPAPLTSSCKQVNDTGVNEHADNHQVH